MAKIVVLLAHGFEEVEAITAIDFLRRAGIDVTALGVSGSEVVGSHDIAVRADVLLADFDGDFDAIVIPGGMPGAQNISESQAAVELLIGANRRGKLIAAICAAPAVVLSRHGLLEDRSATCYPGYEEEYPFAGFKPDRVVVDGNLITSRGPGTAAEFTLAIIRALCGHESAAALSRVTLQPST